MKPIRKITCMKILIPVLALAGSAAYAGPPEGQGKPDKSSKTTQLLEDAGAICASANTAACSLLMATDGHREEGPGKCSGDTTGDANLVYSGRNCDRNEETLLRDAASIVIMTDEAMNTAPEEGDDPLPKWCEVRESLSSYNATFVELVSGEKLAGDGVLDVEGYIMDVDAVVDMYLGDYDCSTV